MIEQKKMDAERVAFEAWWNDDSRLTMRTFTAKHWAEAVWLARASLRVGVPDGYMPIPTARQIEEALENVGSFHDMSAELIAPDLLANLLSAAPTVKAEQVPSSAEWVDPVALSSCGPAYDAGWRDGVAEAKRLNERSEDEAPSLPAAGSAVEEVEVVGYRFFHVDHGYIFRRTHIYEGNPSLEAHSLMTVAQHKRIVAALSAQQAGAVSVGSGELSDALGRVSAGLEAELAAINQLRALLNGGGV